MTDRRILILDDEPAVLGVLADYLSCPGLEIVTCREIEAAEAVLDHKRFHVVVTDLRVSELGGLEGMRLIRYVSTHFPETTVLAMSGYVNDEVHKIGRSVGATAILEKPIDLRRLKSYVYGDNPDLDPSNEGEGKVAEIELLDEFLGTHCMRAYLQPLVTLSAGGPPFLAHAYECLARAPMGSPLRNPEILFAYASRKERLFETDMQCITAALREAKHLSQGSKLFINTVPRSLTNPEFATMVTSMVEEAGFETNDIVFELTEQQTIVNPQAFAATLGTLRDRGFGCALDDYGVGFANLSLIQDLRPDYIKLSGFFGRKIHEDPFKQHLVRSTAEMCNKLKIPTVLENIETDDELEVTLKLGVTYGQGYYFARPAPATELLDGNRFFGPTSATAKELGAVDTTPWADDPTTD